MIIFNKVTWYSKLAAVIFFIGILPILTFYIGTQYEDAKNVSENIPKPIIFEPKTEEKVLTVPTTPISTKDFVMDKNGTLPTKVGHCAVTLVHEVKFRLQAGRGGPYVEGSGSSIEYANNGYQVSYDQIPEVDASKSGDSVKLCLVSLPQGCPPGDERGKFYSATNLRTGGSWSLPDSEHMCGGA